MKDLFDRAEASFELLVKRVCSNRCWCMRCSKLAALLEGAIKALIRAASWRPFFLKSLHRASTEPS
jgi:hypothetical protein